MQSHESRQVASWLIFDVRQKMKITGALFVCGSAWGTIAYALGVTRGEIGIPLACGVVTSCLVWLAVARQIKKSTGWRWFALPFVSIALGTLTFVYLIQAGWWLREALMVGGERYSHVYGYWLNPLFYLFYALTMFIWITYPASLLTHYLLRKYAIEKTA